MYMASFGCIDVCLFRCLLSILFLSGYVTMFYLFGVLMFLDDFHGLIMYRSTRCTIHDVL